MAQTFEPLCAICGGTQFYEDAICGDNVCMECGTVDSQHVPFRSSWNEDDRMDGPCTSWGTQIRSDFQSQEQHLARALASANQRLVVSAEVTLKEWDNLIEAAVGNNLAVHEVVRATMKEFLRALRDAHVLSGRKREDTLAALLYVAAYAHGRRDMSLHEACYMVGGASPHAVRKVAHLVKQAVEAQALPASHHAPPPGAGAPSLGLPAGYEQTPKLVEALCDALPGGAPAWTRSAAAAVTAAIHREGVLEGRAPLTVAAAGVFAAVKLLKMKVSLKAMAGIAGIAPGTLSKALAVVKADGQRWTLLASLVSAEGAAPGAEAGPAAPPGADVARLRGLASHAARPEGDRPRAARGGAAWRPLAERRREARLLRNRQVSRAGGGADAASLSEGAAHVGGAGDAGMAWEEEAEVPGGSSGTREAACPDVQMQMQMHMHMRNMMEESSPLFFNPALSSEDMVLSVAEFDQLFG